MLEPSKIYKVRTPRGKLWNIPEYSLDAAIARGATVIEDDNDSNRVSSQPAQSQNIPTDKMYKVRTPKGAIWDVPEQNLQTALQRGAKLVEEEDSWGQKLARTAKSAVAGIGGGIVDTATSLYNIPASLKNAETSVAKKSNFDFMGENDLFPASIRTEAPLIPSAVEAIDTAIDKATDNYTKTPESGESFQRGIKTAAELVTPGGLAKGAAKAGYTGAAKALGAIGATNPASLAAAGTAGYTTSELEKAGYGTAGAIAGGLAAGAGVGIASAAAGSLKSFDAKLALAKLTGNSPKNIDLDVANAIEKIGLTDYPNTLVNKSKKIALAEQIVSKSPYFGTKYAKKLEGIEKDYANKVEESIKKVGEKIIQSDEPIDIGYMVKDTFIDLKKSIIDEDNVRYFKADKALPEKAEILPTNTAQAFEDIRKSIKTLRPSEPEKFLLNYIDDVEKGLFIGSGNTKTLVKVPVNMLVGSKRSLNNIIDWDINASGVKNQLKRIQRAQKADIAVYGKENPEWFHLFSDADNFHGKYLGDNALGSDTVKKIFAQENPEKILMNLRDRSDFQKLGQSLGRDKAGQAFFSSIKREKLNDLLMGKLIDPKTQNVTYVGFTKVLEDKKNYELIKYLAGDTYKDLVQFNKYAQGMYRRNLRNPNPSGTGATSAIIGAFVGAATKGGIAAKVKSGSYLFATGAALSWFVSSKKMLNWGIEGARKIAAGDTKQATTYFNRIESAMKRDLGEDFVKQLIALSSQESTSLTD